DDCERKSRMQASAPRHHVLRNGSAFLQARQDLYFVGSGVAVSSELEERSRPMRVAVIVLLMLTMTATSRASESCMTKAEAHQHFGTPYLYWHGANRCWDATPPGKNPRATRKSEALKRQESRRQDSMPEPDSVEKLRADM